MKHIGNALLFVTGLIVFTSCEKVISLDLPEGEQLIYADAWISDSPGVHTIRLLESVNYQSQSQPRPIADANISITDITANKTYSFNYTNGSYVYDPGAGKSIGVIGHKYRLEIDLDGERFVAEDLVPRKTSIDSLTLEFKEGDGDFEKQGYYAEFHARDVAGAVDYYWIRTYRNGSLNTYLSDMLSIDASFYPEVSDGFPFIPPFREGVTSGEKPYQKGDEVKVVLRTLSKDSYVFVEQMLKQISNGGLFSEVLQNIPSNITNSNSTGKQKIYGWFGTVGETSATVLVP